MDAEGQADGSLTALGPGKAFKGPSTDTWAAFTATYKDMQQGLLLMALEDLEALVGGGLEKDMTGY